VNTCIFCGPTKEKLTGEHIYSDWISRKFRGFGFNLYDAAVVTNGRRWTRTSGALDVKAPVVCGPCNNVWLGTIERKHLAPFFFEMVRGKPKMRLSVEQQVTLAFWLTRLAMVYEFRDKKPTEATFFTQAEREHFRNVEPLPPKHTWIWMAQYFSESNRTGFIGSHHHYPSGKRDYTDCIHVVNGTIGRFAFQLWSRRWPTLDPPATAIARALRPVVNPFRDYTVQLWPHRNDQLVWHPRFDLVDGSLQKLFDRFGGNTSF
jgi:hypothetical protein